MSVFKQIEIPKHRGKLRKFVGKEYFILKRTFNWWFNSIKFARETDQNLRSNSVFRHKSMLLRPLKDVEMYLQHNKVTNLKIAIERMDKTLIKPGETFSVWRLIGRPTKMKGYKEGLILHNGKISTGIGGGLCQLGNLIYWMALHSPLTIKERWRHGYDVFPDVNRNIPFACGATLAYNYIDLQLENNTESTFQITLWIENGYLNGELYCDINLNTKYEIYETNHIFQQQWWGGYTRHNKIWRRVINLNDHNIHEELVAENNAIMMYNPLLEEK